jgi:hypothetical protein
VLQRPIDPARTFLIPLKGVKLFQKMDARWRVVTSIHGHLLFPAILAFDSVGDSNRPDERGFVLTGSYQRSAMRGPDVQLLYRIPSGQLNAPHTPNGNGSTAQRDTQSDTSSAISQVIPTASSSTRLGSGMPPVAPASTPRRAPCYRPTPISHGDGKQSRIHRQTDRQQGVALHQFHGH